MMDVPQSPREPLAGLPAWIISDGKAGHEAQCLGVAGALGLDAHIKRVHPAGPFKWAAPWAPVGPGEKFGRNGSPFAPPWPAIAFATGRTTIPYIRALKRRAGLSTFTVVLMDPRTGAATADLIWVPEHDRRIGPNVIRTIAAPHVYSHDRLARLRASMPAAIAALPQPRVAVLLGGPNGDYTYDSADIARLGSAILRLAELGAGLMVTPSRRTPPVLLAQLRTAITGTRAIVWDGLGVNPYPDFLAHADAFLVTADSVSMTCEAAATGKPIYIFEPKGGGGKFAAFHAALRGHGATRRLPDPLISIDDWTYTPLDSARAIADEIERRFEARGQWLNVYRRQSHT